jgi:uncharacterized protein YjbI with pentapeptide repeats
MAKRTHVKLLSSPEKWNDFRSAHPNARIDLSEHMFPDEFPFRHDQDLSDVRFDGADLKRAYFPLRLAGASFVGTRMRMAHLQGQQGFYREFNRRGAVFHHAQMSGTRLSHADFAAADFSHADLRGADFDGADLTGANFTAANLTDTTFVGAQLSKAVFASARFERTNFHNAACEWTTFHNLDLGGALNLDAVNHRAPSTITVSTMYWSRGRIPIPFLLGALSDTPEGLIATVQKSVDLVPLKYYSCFVSYSHANRLFAELLYKRLTRCGVRCFMDNFSLKPGEIFDNEIRDAIATYERFLIILSTEALSSTWVLKELKLASNLGHDRVLPVQVNDGVVELLRRLLPEFTGMRHIADFTRWQDEEAFQPQFTNLLAQLELKSQPGTV